MTTKNESGRALALGLWMVAGLAVGLLARAAWQGGDEGARGNGHGDPHAGNRMGAATPGEVRGSGADRGAAPRGEHDHGAAAKRPDAAALGEALARGERLLVDLANPRCPIMGGRADAEVQVEWSGLLVAFCCPGCDDTFLDNPDAYLEELGIDPQPALAALDRIEGASAEELPAVLEEVAARFVLRSAPASGGDREQ